MGAHTANRRMDEIVKAVTDRQEAASPAAQRKRYRERTQHPVHQMLMDTAKSGRAPDLEDIDALKLPRRQRAALVEALHKVRDFHREGAPRFYDTFKTVGKRKVHTAREHYTIRAKRTASDAAEAIIDDLPEHWESEAMRAKRRSETDGAVVADKVNRALGKR